ncbi:MAG: aldo/keto reductase [Mycobacteriaceae bacterium]|nr:aldo/keto reductase [Mycobacteriaceae bacterium]
MIASLALPDGANVPVIGQGTWRMGEGARQRSEEVAALRLGLDLGLTLIDTAEMYGEGGAEEVVGEALSGGRERAFVVSKIYPQNASRRRMQAACDASLRRLRTDRIDLYLLHWRGSVSLAETVEGFEALRAAGKIARWGVSNLDAAALDEVAAAPQGGACAADQVLYNLEARGIEFDLLPWCAAHRMPVMAYSPVGQAGRLLSHPALRRVADRHHATPAQIAVAWTIRAPGVISIPKAADPEHLRQNAAAAGIRLDASDLTELDAAFPPPTGRQELAML